MNKTIEKIEAYKNKEIDKAISKAEHDYKDARDFYNDTGYDRYFKKMQRAEKEIEELKEYLEGGHSETKDLSTEQYREYLKMQKDLNSIKNKVFYIISELGLPATADLINLQDILRDY